MPLYTSRRHVFAAIGSIGVNILPNAERSTSVLGSQAIPRQLHRAFLLANLNSYILSKIGERACDCRLDSDPRRPNLDTSWLVKYVNGAQISADRKEVLSAVRCQDIGGSLGHIAARESGVAVSAAITDCRASGQQSKAVVSLPSLSRKAVISFWMVIAIECYTIIRKAR